MIRYSKFAFVGAILVVAGCSALNASSKLVTAEVKFVDVPANIALVPGRAIAFTLNVGGKRASRSVAVPLSRLGPTKDELVELFAYQGISLALVQSRREGNALRATLKSGVVYVAAVQPRGRLLEATRRFCRVGWSGPADPGTICAQIYCPAARTRIDKMDSSMPPSLRGFEVGGWGSLGNICERCDQIHFAGLIPVSSCVSGNTYAPPSNDTELIAFVSSRTGEPEIYTMRPDGTQIVNISQDPSSADSSPRWSPDGQHILFFSQENIVTAHTWNLIVVDPDGSNWVVLDTTLPGEPLWSPSWSPDGKRIAYARGVLGAPCTLNIVERDASGNWGPARAVTPIDLYSAVVFDGNDHVIVTRHPWPFTLTRVDINSGQLQDLPNLPTSSLVPATSTDGRLSFVGQSSTIDLYVGASDGSGGFTNATNDSASEFGEIWSPNNRLIAYGREISFGSGGKLAILRTDTYQHHELSSPQGFSPSRYAWSWAPDNTRIAYQSSGADNSNMDIYVVDIVKDTVRRLTFHEAWDYDPDWRP